MSEHHLWRISARHQCPNCKSLGERKIRDRRYGDRYEYPCGGQWGDQASFPNGIPKCWLPATTVNNEGKGMLLPDSVCVNNPACKEIARLRETISRVKEGAE